MDKNINQVPQHVVLFPDGNRRWARKKGLDTLEGHLKGENKFNNFLHWCKDRGVKTITVFGFSTENWNRSKIEVKYLMKLFEKYLGEGLDDYDKEGVRVKIIGQKERLPKSLQKTIREVEEGTKDNKKFHLNLAVSYGGRWDITQAIQKIIQERIPAEKITDKLFEHYLSTAGLPAPDLIIRPGGEKRLSNFLLWQAAYSEIYFCDKLWPDFTEKDLDLALEEYAHRQRRFGK